MHQQDDAFERLVSQRRGEQGAAETVETAVTASSDESRSRSNKKAKKAKHAKRNEGHAPLAKLQPRGEWAMMDKERRSVENAQTSERSYRAIEKTKMSAVADKREKAMQEILKSE